VSQPAIRLSGIRGLRPVLWFLAACALPSCGQTNDGPPRYLLRGKVTFEGKPVPAGFITFSPSADRGNQGPGGGAPIVNGSYATPRDKGIVGGAYDVRIVGYDGKATVMEGEELKDGSPLFRPFETTVDLPKEDSVKDFEVQNTVENNEVNTESEIVP
jgi:hypothetical protein